MLANCGRMTSKCELHFQLAINKSTVDCWGSTTSRNEHDIIALVDSLNLVIIVLFRSHYHIGRDKINFTSTGWYQTCEKQEVIGKRVLFFFYCLCKYVVYGAFRTVTR